MDDPFLWILVGCGYDVTGSAASLLLASAFFGDISPPLVAEFLSSWLQESCANVARRKQLDEHLCSAFLLEYFKHSGGWTERRPRVCDEGVYNPSRLSRSSSTAVVELIQCRTQSYINIASRRPDPARQGCELVRRDTETINNFSYYVRNIFSKCLALSLSILYFRLLLMKYIFKANRVFTWPSGASFNKFGRS